MERPWTARAAPEHRSPVTHLVDEGTTSTKALAKSAERFGARSADGTRHHVAHLLRRHLRRLAARGEVVRFGVDVFELEFARQYRRFPLLVLRFPRMELGHHFAREQFQTAADVGVRILAGLVQEDDLIDV